MGLLSGTGVSQKDLILFLTATVALVNELKADQATQKIITDDQKALINNLRAHIIGDELITLPGLAIGSTPDQVASDAFAFLVNGQQFEKAAVAAGTAPAAEVIPQSTYGLWRFEIGADGTIDVAGAADNATGYASEALAIAALPAASADHVSLGHVTVTKSDGAFTGATTNFDAANVTTAYYDGANSISAAISSSSPPATSATDLSLSV